MAKKIGIMQPYFLPYMGYWQLINLVDEFVVYDNIEYTKKGWINRNRFLQNGKDVLFSLQLKADSDQLPVFSRELSPSFERDKLIRQLREAYRKAPGYNENFPLIEEIINYPENNLAAYIENSIRKICDYLGIQTQLTISSGIKIDHENLKAKGKVIGICKALDATDYINPIGGLDLYDKGEFAEQGIDLTFLKSRALHYKQFGYDFIPHMSILDVLMFNSREDTIKFLGEFDLV